MMSPKLRPAWCVAVIMCASVAVPARAQVVNILHNFVGGANDGQNPSGALTLSGSILFGMTEAGGANGDGTVFTIGTNGAGFGVIHQFGSSIVTDGANPFGSLTVSGTTLFGLTPAGGSAANAGTVFSLKTDGSGFGFVHAFMGGTADGSGPLGTLTQSGVTLFGMTPQGGTAALQRRASFSRPNVASR
jgi:uncharacterized repeat protein (TIGR03803 family)